MTTKEVAARSGLSASQVRALVAEKKLTRAAKNSFDPSTAGWEIADYWRARVAKANSGEEFQISNEDLVALHRQLEAMEPFTREPRNGIPD